MVTFLTSQCASKVDGELLGAIITASATIIVQIIGFIVTSNGIKKKFENEMNKQRSNIAISQMTDMPKKILYILDTCLLNSNFLDKSDSYEKMMTQIYSYGSKEAILLAAMIQEDIQKAGSPDNYDMYKATVSYVLLATQIKQDVTGIYVNPELWFKMKFQRYNLNRKRFVETNNKIVDVLELNKQLKMKI